ncbi:hypothetical protein C0L86_05860 [Streptomyces sp. SCA2-2]|nr:hypothetical protein C0L86_05860 [Streptomyces sp. SCA2-2]
MDPRRAGARWRPGPCSPRVRGWTSSGFAGRGALGLLPACAGVDPSWTSTCRSSATVPRTREGEPPGLQRPGHEEPRPWPLSPQSHARSPAMRRSRVLDRPEHRPGRKRRTGCHRRGLLRYGSGAFTSQRPLAART